MQFEALRAGAIGALRCYAEESKIHFRPNSNDRETHPKQNSPLNNESPDKRASFANNSFRQATGQQQQHPPQVPPKPTSSSSRERLKESIEEVNNLDQVN